MLQLNFDKSGTAVTAIRVDAEQPSDQPIRDYRAAVGGNGFSYAKHVRNTQPGLVAASEAATKARMEYTRNKLALSKCTYGLLHIPSGVAPQTVHVLTTAGSHDEIFVPLVDSAGKAVTFDIVGGLAVVLPAAVFSATFVKLQSSPGFEAVLVVRGSAGDFSNRSGIPYRFESTPSSEFPTLGMRCCQVHVPQTAQAQMITVMIGPQVEQTWQERLDTTGQGPGRLEAEKSNKANAILRYERAVRAEVEAVHANPTPSPVMTQPGRVDSYDQAKRRVAEKFPGLLADYLAAQEPKKWLLSSPLPLIDAAGKAVTFRVTPGAACPLPAEIFQHQFVSFATEPGKEFEGKLSTVY